MLTQALEEEELTVELTEELTEELTDELTDELLLAAPHTAPLITGFSATPPFLLAWKPNSTVCPG